MCVYVCGWLWKPKEHVGSVVKVKGSCEHLTWVLETKLWSFAKAVSTPNL